MRTLVSTGPRVWVMGFRACDPLGAHAEFIGLGLLRKEHLYKGPRTGQEEVYPLQLSPHPFMCLGKFMAGRIHQMRSQKSYLAAHPSWFNAHDCTLYPHCGDEPETFSHAILHCPAKASARARHLQGVSSVDQDPALWSSSSLLLSLAAFIKATGTAFPPDMLSSSPPSSPVSMVFPSSPVGPTPVALLASPPPSPL